MKRLTSRSIGALAAMAFAAGGAIPAQATGESTISKEVTSGPCLLNPEVACPAPQPVITNPGFETDILGDGAFIVGASGWTVSGAAGAYNIPASQLTGEAPEGQNVSYFNGVGPSLSQTLSAQYVDGATYELSLAVCNRLNHPFPGYDVELQIGSGASAGTVLAFANETGVSPADDSCGTVTVQHTVSGGPEIGEDISIVLSGDGTQINIDDLSLTHDLTEVVSAVEAKPDTAYEFDFTITVTNATPDLLVLDTLPAEWIATEVTLDDATTDINDVDRCGEENDDVDGVLLEKGGKPGKNCHAATQIEWTPDQAINPTTLKIDAMTRESPGEAHALLAVCAGTNKDLFGGKPVSEAKCDSRGGDWQGVSGPANVFAPTSCGALYLNDGAVLLEVIEGLEPEVLGETRPLCLAVVEDLDGGGIDPSGDGDEDGDGLGDWREACGRGGTNPCEADSDFDGIDDLGDRCPLEGPGTNDDGMVVDTGADGIDGQIGCLRPTLCNDDIDNDGDGLTDWDGDGGTADAACTSNEVDSEDPFDDEDGDNVGDGNDLCLGDDGGGVVDEFGCPIPIPD